MNIAIVGLGYVGLPLSLQFARSGMSVLGLDVDAAKVSSLNQGRSYIKHIESSAIAELVSAGRFSASTDFSRVEEVPCPRRLSPAWKAATAVASGFCMAISSWSARPYA